MPHLAHAVDLEGVLVHRSDPILQSLVLLRSPRRWPRPGGVVGGGGGRQGLADRLDPEGLTALTDVGRHRRCGRSSSAAKKAEADFRISLARRSSQFSRSSSLMRLASSLVVPARRPRSISACTTQRAATRGRCRVRSRCGSPCRSVPRPGHTRRGPCGGPAIQAAREDWVVPEGPYANPDFGELTLPWTRSRL